MTLQVKITNEGNGNGGGLGPESGGGHGNESGVPIQPRNFNIAPRDGGAFLDWDPPRDDGNQPRNTLVILGVPTQPSRNFNSGHFEDFGSIDLKGKQ